MGRSLVPLLPTLYSVFSVVWQLDTCVLLSPWSSYVSGTNCVLNYDPNTCHCQKLCAKFEDDIFTDALNVLFLKHTRSPIAYSTCHDFIYTSIIWCKWSIIGWLTALEQPTHLLLHWLTSRGTFYLGVLKWLCWEISVCAFSQQFLLKILLSISAAEHQMLLWSICAKHRPGICRSMFAIFPAMATGRQEMLFIFWGPWGDL